MTARTYGQHCGLARALDLLGERWTLLVLRELMLGPKRYRDLLARLPGIGTNLLAARLRALEAAQLIERVDAPAPAYALTAAGEDLRAPLEALAIWGFGLLPPHPAGEDMASPAWAALTMRAMMLRAGGPGVNGVFAFTVGDETFWLQARDDDADVRDGPAPVAADAALSTDFATFHALATGQTTVRRAVREGATEVEGDAAALERLLHVFRLPGAERARRP